MTLLGAVLGLITSEADFARALSTSPTFLPQMAPLVAIAFVAPVALVLHLWRRARRPVGEASPGALHADRRGVVVASDFALVILPVILFTLGILQTAWLMRETVIVHYAAYAAARSARVHLCPPLPESLALSMMRARGEGDCTDDLGRAEAAARLALVSAAPPWGIPCLGACEVPEAALSAIARNTGNAARLAALRDQARYAFDADNVRVDVGFVPQFAWLAMTPGAEPPVRARVTFRHYVVYAVGRALGVRRADGYYYRESTAEVSLL